MQRRFFLQSVGLGGAAALVATSKATGTAAPAPMKITRIRFYHNPKSPTHFNQSFHIVTVETDQGITGIGEGGSRDTISQCAAMIIGEDPFRIEHLWQMMFRGYFYPAGREKLDALGAIDLALWDLKGKALGVPVYELLGGFSRDHLECYSTGFPSKGSLKETARACLEAGFRAFRYATADPRPASLSTHIRWCGRHTRTASRYATAWEKTAIGRWITTPASTSRMPCGSAH